jgi:hypothetical protein
LNGIILDRRCRLSESELAKWRSSEADVLENIKLKGYVSLIIIQRAVARPTSLGASYFNACQVPYGSLSKGRFCWRASRFAKCSPFCSRRGDAAQRDEKMPKTSEAFILAAKYRSTKRKKTRVNERDNILLTFSLQR